MRTARKAGRRVETAALIVRSVPYGEGDLVITALTEQEGKVSALVRGARRGSKRAASAALEPIHTVAVAYEDKGTDLVTLKEARVTRPRTNVLTSLERLEAAGTLLRWARHVFPPKTAEPAAFATIVGVLDALDGGAEALVELASGGLRLLGDVGWGLELERCVRCGTRCPDDASAQVDTRQGGVLCRRCGKTGLILRSTVRRVAVQAQRSGASPEQLLPVARGLIELVESTMSAHTGFSMGRAMTS